MACPNRTQCSWYLARRSGYRHVLIQTHTIGQYANTNGTRQGTVVLFCYKFEPLLKMVSAHILEIYVLMRALLPPGLRTRLDHRMDAFEALWRCESRQRRGKRTRVWTYVPRWKQFQTKVLAAHWAAENFFLVQFHCGPTPGPTGTNQVVSAREQRRIVYDVMTGQAMTLTRRLFVNE